MKRLGFLIEAGKVDGRHRLLFWRLFFGALVGCLVSLFYSDSPLLETLEMDMLEWRYKIADRLSHESWFPKAQNKATQSICIVAFDDASQFDLGFARFNDQLSQAKLSELINRIEDARPVNQRFHDYGPARNSVDPDSDARPRLVIVDLDLRGAVNQALTETLARHHNVVLSLFGSLEGSTDLPAGDFLSHAASYGYHELAKEPGGMVLRLPDETPTKQTNEVGNTEQVPSLTRAALNAYRGISGVDYATKLVPERPDQFAYINYHNVNYPLYTMSQVLDPNFDSSVFKDKIVLIGSTLTPRRQDLPRAKVPFHKEQPEILIQADALATVINNEIIWSFPHSYRKQFLIVVGALVGAIASALPLGSRAMAMLLSAVLLMLIAQFAFQFLRIALPVVSPLVMILSGFILGTVIYLDTNLRQRNRELAAARTMMQVRAEEERKRIAEDLHDETLPALSSIARMVDDMGADFSGSTVPRVMREKLDETIQEMRRVINDLHPSVLETMGFLPALENLVRILEREISIEGNFQTSGDLREADVPEFVKLQLYRMVQEALNNVRKHSQAGKVEVDVYKSGDMLRIVVVDDGLGIDPSKIRPDSHGLLNVRHRAALIGASVAWSRPKKYATGTEFSVAIQLGSGEKVEEAKDDNSHCR